MKIRQSLVANSSSSSFVIYGWKVPNKDLAKMFSVDEDDLWDALEGMSEETDIDYLGDDAPLTYVGKVLADISNDECLDDSEMHLSELLGVVLLAKEELGLTETPKFYMGTRSS